MKILVFSDIHGDYRALERLMRLEADYYFAAGDLTSWGRGLDRCGEILRQRAEKVYVLPGNHESEDSISAFCLGFGLQYFHQRSFKVDGRHIAGLGYSNPTPFHTPGEYTEAQLAQHLAAFAGLKPLVLVCHCPPHGTPLDLVRKGVHAGSLAVREFIEKHQPELFFCGHIHEAGGVAARIGDSHCFNTGPQGRLVDFAKIENV